MSAAAFLNLFEGADSMEVDGSELSWQDKDALPWFYLPGVGMFTVLGARGITHGSLIRWLYNRRETFEGIILSPDGPGDARSKLAHVLNSMEDSDWRDKEDGRFWLQRNVFASWGSWNTDKMLSSEAMRNCAFNFIQELGRDFRQTKYQCFNFHMHAEGNGDRAWFTFKELMQQTHQLSTV